MSIELGYAPCTLGDLEVGIVDVPGHEHFIRTMVAGASGMDACILVVAADDGPMPQTREHLDILTLLDVRKGMVALTKVDRVSAEELQVVREVLGDFLKGTFLENAPVIAVSNITGEGLGELHERLTDLVRAVPPKRTDGVFRLPVERAFSIKGHGTVVAGVPLSGSVRVEDEIVLLPDGLATRIKAIQVYGRESPVVKAGQCAAINVRHWDHRSIQRGKTVTVPGFFEPRAWCVGRLQLLEQDQLFIRNGAAVRFHTGTSERLARIYMLAGDGLHGGGAALAQMRFEEPIVAGPGDRFIVRALSPPRTIGGGVIIETMPHRLNRNRPGLVQACEAHLAALGSEESLVAFHAASDELPVLDSLTIARRAKVPVGRTGEILEELARADVLIRTADGGYIHRQAAERWAEDLLSRLASFHRESPESPGLSLEDLRQTWDLPAPAAQAVIARLKAAGRIAERDQRLALGGHRPMIEGADAAHLERLEALFRARPFAPPEPAELAASLGLTAPQIPRLLRILLEQGKLLRIDRDLLFHREAVAQARGRLVNHIREKGRLESVEFKYLLDTSRKYAIPLLDYFDRTGVTRRMSDNTRLLRNPEAVP